MNPATSDPACRAIWRWHFYAGLACVPLILWLACTGALYVWKPQVEALIDRPFDHLVISGPAATPAAEVRSALAAVPGATFQRYELPQGPHSAARVIVKSQGKPIRVYVNPYDLAVLKRVGEDDRFMQVVFRLHGELLMGNRGSYVVELVASWAIVLILSGLYLWWPRGTGLGGVLWPRIGARGRPLWRDLHAVAGFWVSALVLFMLVSGLPWAKGWGSYLQEVRALSGSVVPKPDWPIGAPPAEHAGHHMAMTGMIIPFDGAALNRVVPAARGLGFVAPVLLDPPTHRGGAWAVASETQDRPMRANATIDGATGAVLSRTGFSQRLFLDRAVGYGVAMHEGHLFGIVNQIMNTLVACAVFLVAVSGAVMWWKRRPEGGFGAPTRHMDDRLPIGARVVAVFLGIALPFFGVSAVLFLLLDRALRGRVSASGSGHLR